MKRIACKTCNRPRICRPKSGEGVDVPRRATLKDGREVRTSSLPARQDDCLPCRRKAGERKKTLAKAKVFGEMTRVVVRAAKDEKEKKR